MKICTLIVNPTSGAEKAKKYEQKMTQQLHVLFDQVVVRKTKKAGDAKAFATQAAESGHDAVFCMGGDGTVNETVNGLAATNKPISFGFIPLGTVNDLARALGIPLEPEAAIEMLEQAVLINLDIGKVNDVYFVSNVAAGTIPEAVHEVSIEEKTRYGSLAYFIQGGKALLNQETHAFQIMVDGETFTQKSPLIVIALSNSVASFESFMPQAKVADGKLRMVIFKPFRLADSLKLLPQIIKGEITESDRIVYRTFNHARLSLIDEEGLTTNVDGDRGPHFPLEVEVLPSFLKVFAPRGTSESGQ